MKRLLAVIDMQNDFIDGALGSAEAKAVVEPVAKLIGRERGRGTEVCFTLDTHGENYLKTQEGKRLPIPHCLCGTKGHELVQPLKDMQNGAPMFAKGAFGSLELAEYVRQNAFEEIILCGVCTDICVVSNALLIKAYCPEAAVFVAADACAGTTPQNHAAALQTMRSCQIGIL